ncbi:MAG: YggS family pyridoxal phosphate enzyme, partial [Acidobacteria bacterium]|nr:YggS family pyridoxal phosphate enzyme [Acidobacteriota bacterium]
MVSVAQNLERIHERIDAALKRADRRDEVTLVVVTKTIAADKIVEAYRCGVRRFGENRVQEFKEKRPLL